VLAVRAYYEATGHSLLVEEVMGALREIIAWHMAGTRFGIGADPADGLLHAGEPGLQLTWMDAKVGDWVVTPRIGKPVEINALWYNVLRAYGDLLSALGGAGGNGAHKYRQLADRVRTSFRMRFVRRGLATLADVVDGPDGDDLSVRPNQILAISLPYPLLDEAEAATVLDVVGRELLTSYGLRSLDRGHHAYRATYGGDPLTRDGAYHQGTVWAWLLGPYAEAYYRVTGDAEGARRLLEPIVDHVRDAGLGSVSEIFDADPPHAARGCVAQAWSVAEILRVWRITSAESGRRAGWP
jgi:4-alpha-glucanotransferase